MSKDIALALGGGGVRGFAHLGVLHVLQKSGFTIRAISGTSAGAIIGSLVAAGYHSHEIQEALESIDPNRLFQRRSEDLPAILGLFGLEEKLRNLIGEKKFGDLKIPFAAVAVDSQSGKSVVLREGDVIDAVMASSAVPGFFPPREIAGRTYFDGGVNLPVPVAPVRRIAPGFPVVAVALSPPLDKWGEYEEFLSLSSALPILQRFVDRSRLAQSISAFLTAVDIGSVTITDLTLEKDPPDVLIRPKVFHVGLLEQARAESLITAGEDATFECMDRLLWLVSWRRKLSHAISSFLKFSGEE